MDKHYDFKTAEKKAQLLWAQLGLHTYKADQIAQDQAAQDQAAQDQAAQDPSAPGQPLYSIDTPPPTVSGALHIGHIFSYTQAEIIARYKRMKGFKVFYPFGFDDNGLPTERLVERAHGIRANQMTTKDFTSLCLETTKKYEADFRALWEFLGFSCDWNLQYETISASTQRIAQRSFIDLYRKGLAYRKAAPVLWCPHCQTSIAQADVDQQEKNTYFVHLAFNLVDEDGAAIDDGAAIAGGAPIDGADSITIATTRPEMLYGCVAVFVHPKDERYQKYIGRQAVVPLYGHAVPILADDQADMTKGTGAVMCCTFGDSTDLAWYESHKLPYRETILGDGRLHGDIAHIGGMFVNKGRAAIIDILQDRGLLIEAQAITHSYAIHERCEQGIEILPSPQWYIDVLNHKEELLEAGKAIVWHPAHMKARYLNWVSNLKWDWCISRQRFFGVPFPVWYCADCGAIKVAEEGASGGAEGMTLPIDPRHTGPGQACSCGCTRFEPETAVMDTWMTSSVTPQINAKWGEADERPELMQPMGLRSQAHEIIRTWAFYTIAKSLYHFNQLPWTHIMISGFVLAKRGQKISKSKDNSSMDPKTLIETHSADAMRYWTAGTKLGTDTFFDPTELATAKRLMNKLWNAGKFTQTLLADYSGSQGANLGASQGASQGAGSEDKSWLLPIDQWILMRSQEVLEQMSLALDDFEMGSARQVLDHFFWGDFCDDYLELVKSRLYQPENFGQAQRLSGQYALYHTFLNILMGYAIYMPHLTETLYQALYTGGEGMANTEGEGEETITMAPLHASLHALRWPAAQAGFGDDGALADFGLAVKALLADARRYKSDKNLSMKAAMPSLEVAIEEGHRAWWFLTTPDLLATTHAEGLVFRGACL